MTFLISGGAKNGKSGMAQDLAVELAAGGTHYYLATMIPVDEEDRERIRRAIGKPVSDEAIDAAWNSFLDGIPAYKLAFLLDLRKRYRLYLLSNTNAIHWEYACTHEFNKEGHRVEDYFDRIFLSYRMKMIKPDAGIFQAVLQETGILPAETLFIDDAEANCRTAQSLGIRTYTPQAHEDWRHLFQ